MTGPSSSPRGERGGTVPVTWQTTVVRTETVINDDPVDTAGPDANPPIPPRPNRATRRALARAARRTK
ncbi:hypothetical protein IHE56_00965 [Streptomyces sp. ID01-12c]|nr:hypothetical protein [Streptomyces caniscabiei]